MKRRDFLKTTAGITAGMITMNHSRFNLFADSLPDLVVVKEGEPETLVREAIAALGGMSRFISKGDIVVMKPNISWDRVPAQGATTNPQVVAEVVKMCFDAGAKKVKIFDYTLNESVRCYKRSGIEKAAKEAGADVTHIYERRFKKVRFPEGELIKSWEVYKDVLEADKIINIPIAKHHSISGVSLGMKNFMGWIGGSRGKLHRDFDIKITDLNTKIKADLTILDAYRILLRNGPSGGNIKDVAVRKTLIAGTDPVAIDSYGASLFSIDSSKINFLQIANKRGLGEIDYKKINMKEINLTT